MINKDYILRIAERVGRELAILLHLRERNQYEEALIYIDELFLQNAGLTTGFINSVSEEMLLTMLSPLGVLNIEKCLWIATLLKAEGDIYLDQGKSDESYHRYLKSLYLFLEVLSHDNDIHDMKDLDVTGETEDILNKLEEYELPQKAKNKLFRYFEMGGRYDKAENILFEMVEGNAAGQELVEQGIAFYTRLMKKSDADLLTGNLSREEVEEGLEGWKN